MATYAYYAVGSTLAGLVNVETYTEFPPRAVDGNAIPLLGGVRRRALSGRPRASGWINGVLLFEGMTRDAYRAFVYAVFGGFDVTGVQRYFTLFDESGAFSPFQGYIERATPTYGDDSTLLGVAFPLSKLVLQSVTKTANYTVGLGDHLVYGDTTSGNVTLTLPALSGVTQNVVYSFQKTAAANSLVIDGNGSETVNGNANVTLTAQHARVDLVSNGSQWLTI